MMGSSRKMARKTLLKGGAGCLDQCHYKWRATNEIALCKSISCLVLFVLGRLVCGVGGCVWITLFADPMKKEWLVGSFQCCQVLIAVIQDALL